MRYLFSSCALGLTLALSGCGGGGGDTAAPVQPVVPPVADTIVLQKIDNVVGTGAPAIAGKTVSVQYTGWLYDAAVPSKKGVQFDSSVGKAAFSFVLDSGSVIKGFDQGVTGMQVGGKRTVLIPASMGYGAQGNSAIPPNSNLVFDIELVEVR